MPKAAPPELRANAVRLAQQIGVRAAATETGVSPASVSRWCIEEGVETVPNQQTARAREAASLSYEDRKARLADRLLEIADMGTAQTLAVLEDANLRDLVGAWTRAIHDAQLLTGGPTQSIQQVRQVEDVIDEVAQRRKLKAVA